MGGKLVKADREIEADFKLTALVSQLKDLTTKIFEVENHCKRQRRYMPIHRLNKSREDEKSRIERTLQIILQKITNQDRVLVQNNREYKALIKFTGSHSR